MATITGVVTNISENPNAPAGAIAHFRHADTGIVEPFLLCGSWQERELIDALQSGAVCTWNVMRALNGLAVTKGE